MTLKISNGMVPVAVLVLVIPWFATATATAAFAAAADPTPSAETTNRAKQHFTRGVSFYKEGSLDAALAEFNKAYEIRPDFRLLYNIGQVQAERRDFASALKALRQYLKDGGDAVEEERRSAVDQTMRSLLTRVAELTVTADVPAAEVVIDGAVAGMLPLAEPLVVNAGIREVTVRKSGRTAAARRVTIASGEDMRLEFQLDRDANQALPSTPADELTGSPPPTEGVSRPSRRRVWLAFAAAGALGAGAVTFALLARQADRDLEGSLAQFPGNGGQIADDRSKLKSWAVLTDGFGAAAVVAAALGVYFVIELPDSGKADGPSSRVARLQLALPSTPGLALSGTF
jgi:tetratricopeptide (TPR) repeat protein